MFIDLDDTIKYVLMQGGQLAELGVDVSFDIPDREWSQGIARPTLNCYLFDIRENRELRQHGVEQMAQTRTSIMRQRPPMYFDLTYLVTAWTQAVEDEHRLLWLALHTLTRFETIPSSYLQGALADNTHPIHTRTAMADGVLKSPGEFWTALENQLKPSLSYVATIAVDRELFDAGPPVQSARFRFARNDKLEEAWSWFGGMVHDRNEQPLTHVLIELKGHTVSATSDATGRFKMRIPGPGTYTLIVHTGTVPQQREITIPHADYAIEVDHERP